MTTVACKRKIESFLTRLSAQSPTAEEEDFAYELLVISASLQGRVLVDNLRIICTLPGADSAAVSI